MTNELSDVHAASSPSFRILFDAIPSPSLLVDPDVRVLDMNAAALVLHSICKECREKLELSLHAKGVASRQED